MRLVRYRGDNFWKPLETLQDEINRLFEFPFGQLSAGRQDMLAPSVDVWEDKDTIHIEADLPGFQEKDIDVKLKGDTLAISAKREESKEEKRKNYYCCERFQGSFYRTVGLPSSVDASKINAKYNAGTLKVTLPKREDAKEKEIKIDVN